MAGEFKALLEALQAAHRALEDLISSEKYSNVETVTSTSCCGLFKKTKMEDASWYYSLSKPPYADQLVSTVPATDLTQTVLLPTSTSTASTSSSEMVEEVKPINFTDIAQQMLARAKTVYDALSEKQADLQKPFAQESTQILQLLVRLELLKDAEISQAFTTETSCLVPQRQ